MCTIRLMYCPYCNSATKVTNSRSHNKNKAVWRRRQCKNCDAIWSTDEKYDLHTTHMIKSTSQNHMEPFSRDLLFVSIRASLIHRKSPTQDASALTDTIIGQVLSLNQSEIDSAELRQLTYDTLHKFDKTAAAVYISTQSQ